MVAIDVDGTLTDGRLYYGDEGELLKTFHVRDGYGLRLLAQAGITLTVISGRRSRAVERRMTELGISQVHLGCSDKRPLLEQLTVAAGLSADAVAAIGDDRQDLGMMQFASLGVAVADAHADVISAADWVTSRAGGHGAVRELCDLILEAQLRQ